MTEKTNVTGKTYDQQLEIVGDQITGVDITPNRRLDAEMAFEPMGNGVRVTARDGSHRTLWGFTASRGMLDDSYCLVAVYEPLVRLITDELERHALPKPDQHDPVEEAQRSIKDLEERLRLLKSSLKTEKRTAASVERANLIARATSEARRQLLLDTEGLKGMQAKARPEPGAND